MRLFKYCLSIVALITLAACGGGGSDSSSSSSTSTTPASTISLATPAGTACTKSFSNTDAFGNTSFQVSGTGFGTEKLWSCLVVDKANNQPVYSGTQSVRFETRPGDCFVGIGGYDDCANDRSHNDLMATQRKSTQGQIITYEYYMYLPSQPLITPPSAKGCYSTTATLLAQINWINQTGTSYGQLLEPRIDETGLFLNPQLDWTFANGPKVPLDSNPYNKWIKLKYVIKSTASADGYIQVYMNDQLVYNQTRATLPGTDYQNMLKIGFYDGQISCATQPWQTQVVYFDGISTTITNF